MYCIKCGKETKTTRVFCDDCLATMEDYPVSPGTPVQLPRRIEVTTKKQPSRKKVLTPEEQLPRLRKAIGWMGLTISVLIIALAATVTILINSLGIDPIPENIGQNYSTIDSLNGT